MTARRSTSWTARAACLGEDPERWFPGSDNPVGIEDAKAACRRCPVRAECLEDALRLEDGTGPSSRWGVRAGLTGKERHAVARRRARAVAQKWAAGPAPEPIEGEPRWVYMAEMAIYLQAHGHSRAEAADRMKVTDGWLRACLRRYREERAPAGVGA